MEKTAIKTIGILTSGGDAPGLNSAIRGICRSAMNNYGIKIIGIRNGFRGLVNDDCFELKSEDVSGILTRGGTILGTARDKPFKNPVPNPKTGLLPLEAIQKNWRKWKLDALAVLGGNGTNTTGSLLADEGFNVVGLPKTIDNDIVGSDITFGFHTAVDVAAEAIDRIHTTAHSHSRVMVVEVMGHKAGWLGLYSGIAGGGDVVLLPEIPYDIQSVAAEILRRRDAGKDFSIVVVAEGALSKDEAKLDKKAFKKSRREMPYSIGYRVAHELESATGLESRVTVLGYLQRGGTPSPYDRVLATRFGVAATDFIVNGKFGNLVAMQDNKIVAVPLKELAGKVKNIPLDHPLLASGRAVGMSFGE